MRQNEGQQRRCFHGQSTHRGYSIALDSAGRAGAEQWETNHPCSPEEGREKFGNESRDSMCSLTLLNRFSNHVLRFPRRQFMLVGGSRLLVPRDLLFFHGKQGLFGFAQLFEFTERR